MTTGSNSAAEQQTPSLAKPLLIGGGVGLVLISIFLSGVHDPNPAWGKLWMIRPLVIVPLAGAMGGLFYYFMRHLTAAGSLNKSLALVLSLFVYVVGLWLGTVLGLDGTLWD
jgi:hypothetical protein